LDLQLPVPSVPITTKVVSLNLVYGEMYLDASLCDEVYQWLVAGWWFSLGTQVTSSNKIDCYDITEIVLKVTLKHYNPNPYPILNLSDNTVKCVPIQVFTIF
jgi:hypothetical protein